MEHSDSLCRCWGPWCLGGFASLYSVRYGLVAAISELRSNLSSGRPDEARPGDGTSPPGPLSRSLLAAFCVLAWVNYRFTSGIGITLTGYGRDAGHGLLLHCRRELHRGLGGQLQ